VRLYASRVIVATTVLVAGVVLVAPLRATASSLAELTRLLGALRSPRRPGDTLPPSITRGMWAPSRLDRAHSRRVGHYRGYTFYLAPAAHDRLCLLAARGPQRGAATFGNCLDRAPSQLKSTRYAYTGRGRSDGALVLAIVVVNGYTRLSFPGRAVVVRHNMAFVTFHGANLVGRLSGAGRPTVRVPLPPSPDHA
jgi:hypothetical protein